MSPDTVGAVYFLVGMLLFPFVAYWIISTYADDILEASIMASVALCLCLMWPITIVAAAPVWIAAYRKGLPWLRK